MEDWLPSLLAAAGEPDIKNKLLKGHRGDGKNFNVHLDAYNMLPYFTGQVEERPRNEMFYFTATPSSVPIGSPVRMKRGALSGYS